MSDDFNPETDVMPDQPVDAQILPTFEEWRRNRGTYIGGSDAAAILGLSPYRTIGEVWLEKIRAQDALENETPLDDPDVPTRFTRWGKKWEPLIIEEYAEQTQNRVEMPGLTLYRHPEHPFIGGTIDATAVTPFGDKRIVEAKTTDGFLQWREQIWGPSGSSEVPDWYLVQLFQYLVVRRHEGFLVGDFAVLIGGNDFRILPVEWEQDFEDLLLERLVWFWRLVTRREPPPFDYQAKGAVELQKRIWNKVNPGSSITVPSTYSLGPDRPSIMELIIEHDDMKAVAEEATARQEAAKAELIHMAGENSRVMIEGTKIGVTRAQRAGHHVNEYDVKPYIETSFTPRTIKKREELLSEHRLQLKGRTARELAAPVSDDEIDEARGES